MELGCNANDKGEHLENEKASWRLNVQHSRSSLGTMRPLVNDGDTVAADSSATDISKLNGENRHSVESKDRAERVAVAAVERNATPGSENRNFKPISLRGPAADEFTYPERHPL